MAHFYKTPKGWRFQVDIYDPVARKTKKKRIGPFRTKKDAEVAAAQLAVQKFRGVGAASEMTLEEFIETIWLPNRKAKGLSPTTINGYEYQSPHIARLLGSVRLCDLTGADVARFVADFGAEISARGTPRKPGSIKAAFTALHAALSVARRLGYVHHNVASDVAESVPKVIRDRDEVDWWDPAQIRVYLDAVIGDRLNALWRLLFLTGVRRSEVAGLRWSDVDWEAGTITVRRGRVHLAHGPVSIDRVKNKASYRTLTLDPGTLAALRDHQERQNAERKAFGSRWRGDDHIFTGVKTGQPIRPDYVYARLQTLARRAGLPAISVHDTRRSYINSARQVKVPTETTAELVGHANDRTTKDYYHREIPRLQTQAAAQIASFILGEDVNDQSAIDSDRA